MPHRRWHSVAHRRSLFTPSLRSLAAAMFPQLFTSLILIDPIILRPWEKKHLATIEFMVKGALNRRDTWSSRYVHTHIPKSNCVLTTSSSEKKHTNHFSRAPSLTSGTQPYSNSTLNAPSTSPQAHTRRQSSRCQVCRKLWCSPKRIRNTRFGITLRIWMRGFRLDGSCPGCREGRMLVVRGRRSIECG